MRLYRHARIAGIKRCMPGEQSVFSRKAICILLVGIVIVRFATLPAYPIFDKSEARYAYIAELMVQTNNWITPFVDHGVPFWAKPILSIWLTAASLSLFGINAFAARLPAFLIYVVVGWLVFVLGRGERNSVFGLAAACVFASNAVAFYLGGTVLTDPALMLGITLAMTSFWKCAYQTDEQSSRRLGLFVFRRHRDWCTCERPDRRSSSGNVDRGVAHASSRMAELMASIAMDKRYCLGTSAGYSLVCVGRISNAGFLALFSHRRTF